MMIPITRKEKYINEIVGGGDTAPETPQTREEFFFAEILGEVIAPSPVTRVEKYLSAIARQYSGDLPTPITRIEYFLAKAAGMEIETPIPITREEMLWDTYISIKTIEGIPPLTFKAKKAGTLKNYRIYGQTSRNLFEYDSEEVYSNSTLGNLNLWAYADFSTGTVLRIPCTSNTTYTLSIADDIEHSVFRISTTYLDITPPHEVQSGQTGSIQCSNLINDGTLRTATFTTSGTAKYILFQTNTNIFQNAIETLMLNVGSTGLPYEPYGESVGDRTENLFANLWKKGYIRADNGREEQIDGFICSGFFPVEYGQTYSISRNINVGYDNIRGYRDNGSFIGAGTDICDVSNPFPSTATNIGAFTVTNENVAFVRFNDSANDLGMKYMIVKGTYTEQTMPDYEPYGYKVPVTVSNGTDTLTTPIYLPEQIRKVGDEAEYVDYKEQKQHRVRKNLLQNTATSSTINGVTFTANEDGSVTCNGTATNIIEVRVSLDFLLPPGNYRLTGCPPGGWSSYPGGKVSYCLRTWYSISGNVTWFFDYGDGCNFTLTDTKNMRSSIVIEKAQVVDNITFYPMIRKADIEDDTYEPYIEDTEVDVTLPALPTLSGTNTLTVGTEVQPSSVEIKGKIQEVTP